jgi:hypothetical protein
MDHFEAGIGIVFTPVFWDSGMVLFPIAFVVLTWKISSNPLMDTQGKTD